jgi:hypothetical protein
MRKPYRLAAAAALPLLFLATGAAAQTALAGSTQPDTLQFKPLLEARLRYEDVEQEVLEANALTLRVRAGVEARLGGFSALVEAEGTAALGNDYNAFPFLTTDSQRRPQYSVIADPKNLELNRAQLQYKQGDHALTVGRQRINLDDQRWVGSVGWRQNEQTLDAVRGEAKLGPVLLDGAYALSQRSIWGIDSGPRQAMAGDFGLLGAGVTLGPVQAKGFAYLLDYDADEEPYFLPFSSQTYGVRAVAAVPLGPKLKIGAAASYARQSDYGDNPVDYAADYLAAEGWAGLAGFTLTAGYERLGSDDDVPGGFAVQTPMATLHKFNGWADVFLTTPAAGLEDRYAGVAYKFDGVKLLPGLNAALVYHQYDSDTGDVDYGHEWNASLGFKLGPVGVLAKYADYDADGFSVDTEKFWLQAEVSY